MVNYADTFTLSGGEVAGEELTLHAAEGNTWAKQAHGTGNVAPGSASVSAAGRLYQAVNSAITRYIIENHQPASGFYDITVGLYALTIAGNTGALFRASTTDLSGYALFWSSANKIGLYRLNSAGATATQLGTLVDVGAGGLNWLTGQLHTARISSTDAGSGGLKLQVYLDGNSTAALNVTDPSPLPVTGKVGVYFSGNSNAIATTGIQIDSLTIADPSTLTCSANTLPPGTGGVTVTLTNSAGGYTVGTPGSPAIGLTYSGSPGTPPAIVTGGQTVDTTSTIRITISTGTAAVGSTVTLTDPNSGLSVILTIQATVFAGVITPGVATQTSIAMSASQATGGTLPYVYQWYFTTTAPSLLFPFVPSPSNALVGATGLSLNHAGLPPGLQVWYIIGVTDGTGASSNSAIVSNQTLPASTLVAGVITQGAIGQTTAGLTASAAGGGVAPYAVQWYRVPGQSDFTPSTGTAVNGATSLALNDTGLTPDGFFTYKVRYTDAQGTHVDSDPSTVHAAAAGVATGLKLTPPVSGPQNYAGDTSSAFTIAIDPPGGTISGTINVVITESPGGGTFAPGGATGAIALSQGTPSATFTLVDATAGVKTLHVTNDRSLTNPADLTYTVMTPLQVTLSIVAAYGVPFSGQAATLGFIVYDANGNILVGRTTGKTYEAGATGVYMMFPVVPWDAAGVVLIDAPTGQGAPAAGFAEGFVPAKPGISILGGRDTAAIWDTLSGATRVANSLGAKVAGWVLGTDGRALVSADVHTSRVTVANMTDKTGTILDATGLDTVHAPAASTNLAAASTYLGMVDLIYSRLFNRKARTNSLLTIFRRGSTTVALTTLGQDDNGTRGLEEEAV